MSNKFVKEDLENQSKKKGSYMIDQQESYSNDRKYPPFKIYHEQHILENKDQFEFLTVKASNWVQIIAKNNDEFILIEQYRPAWRHYSIEFPAGKIDSEEEPLAAAKRELAEETGFKAKKWSLIGISRPVTWTTQIAYTFLAEELEITQAQPDPEEIINVINLSKEQISAMILSGEIIENPSVSAWMFYRLHYNL
ncbi:MAG: NUDIX hydrolase [Candidatus Heimdallarchaeota archaeon]|nr:NUDIX hydrolase [Candidatus Heimdallarchaeota archaeon]MCK5048805.1 NUDIX hydrolase [Candidatus Heimdallarchaeota archaeon]